MKPSFNVVGAAIVQSGKIFALRRADGIDSVIHKFEFVGGKIEAGETPEQALKRECMEELSLTVDVGERLTTVHYEYPEFSISLSVYLCRMLSGYVLTKHEEERWIPCNELTPDEWAPADRVILNILRTGYVKLRLASNDGDFAVINRLGSEIMHRTFDSISKEGQTDYMVNLFLSDYAIKRNIEHDGYVYKIIQLNGEDAGFYAYCPAQNYNPAYTSGTFLSKIYLSDFARNKKIASRVFLSLPKPVVLTVKKDNADAISIYKHVGFKIIEGVVNDIGGGYVMDDYVMKLS